MNKKYFTFLLKNNKKPIITLLCIYFLCVPFPYFFVDSRIYVSSSFPIAMVLLISSLFIVPIVLNYKYFHKKSVDTYLSFPIKREKMMVTELVFGYILAVGLWAMFTIMTLFIIAVRSNQPFIWNVFLIIPFVIVVGAIIYLINSIIILNANNIFDAIIFVIAYTFLPMVVIGAIHGFLDRTVFDFHLPIIVTRIKEFLSPVIYLRNGFPAIFSNDYSSFSNVIFILYSLLLFGLFLIYLRVIRKYKGENAEQISNFKMGYPAIIPCYIAAMLVSILGNLNTFVSIITTLCFIFVFYLIIHYVKNRKIYFTWKILVGFVTLVLVILGMKYLIVFSEGMGMGKYVPKDYEEIDILLYDGDYSRDPISLSIKKDDELEKNIEVIRNTLKKDFYDQYFKPTTDWKICSIVLEYIQDQKIVYRVVYQVNIDFIDEYCAFLLEEEK